MYNASTVDALHTGSFGEGQQTPFEARRATRSGTAFAAALIALAGNACDPVLVDPVLPTPGVRLVVPTDGAVLREVGETFTVTVEVLDCAQIETLEVLADERQLVARFRQDVNATLTATVALTEVLAVNGLDALALPGERSVVLRARGRCADFGAPFESPPHEVLISPFESLVSARARPRQLFVVPVEGRAPELYALTESDFRQMSAASGCDGRDYDPNRSLVPCWINWSQRPSGVRGVFRGADLTVVSLRCTGLTTGRLCPEPPDPMLENRLRSVIGLFIGKFIRIESLEFPVQCDVDLRQVSDLSMVLISTCGDGTRAEVWTLQPRPGGAEVIRSDPIVIPGGLYAIASPRGQGQVDVYMAVADGRLERWRFNGSAPLVEPLALSVADSDERIRFHPDGSRALLIRRIDSEGDGRTEVEEVNASTKEILRSWTLLGRGFVRGYVSDAVWGFDREGYVLLDDGIVRFTVSGRVENITASKEGLHLLHFLDGAVHPTLSFAGLDGTVEVRVPDLGLEVVAWPETGPTDRIYGSLGEFVYTLEARPILEDSPVTTDP